MTLSKKCAIITTKTAFYLIISEITTSDANEEGDHVQHHCFLARFGTCTFEDETTFRKQSTRLRDGTTALMRIVPVFILICGSSLDLCHTVKVPVCDH